MIRLRSFLTATVLVLGLALPIYAQTIPTDQPEKDGKRTDVFERTPPFTEQVRDLKHALEQGKTVKATLKFEKAGTVDVEYPILAIGASAPGTNAGGGMNMQGGGMMKMDKH